MVSKDDSQSVSITDALSQETFVSTEDFQGIQEDIKLAEKDRIIVAQKRKELLESLRETVQKVRSPLEQRETLRKEYVRLIRDGVATDAEAVTNRLVKELQILKYKGLLSPVAEHQAKEFHDQAKIFIEKKRLLERVEQKINALSQNPSQLAGAISRSPVASASTPDPELLHAKIVVLASSLRNDTVRLLGNLLALYERLEDKIQTDSSEEENARNFFFACLSVLEENPKRQILAYCRNLTLDAGIEKRKGIYKTLVEEMAKSHPVVAAKIHTLARKKARDFLKQGHYEKAKSELCYALQIHRDDASTYRLLATVLLRQGDPKGAFAALREIARLCPEDIALRKRIADQWVQDNQKEQAVREYEEILARSPEEYAVRKKLAKILAEIGAWTRIPPVLDSYLQQYAEDKDSLKTMGQAWLMIGNFARAVAYLKKAVDPNQNDPEALRLLAMAFRKMELYPQALSLLEQGLKISPHSSVFLILLGSLYQECGEWEKAETIYIQALESQPNSIPLLQALGQVQSALGKTETAAQTYESILRIDDRSRESLLELGKSFRKRKEYDRAQAVLDQAIRQNGSDTETQQELAALYMEMGQWAKATAILQGFTSKSAG